MVRYNMWMDKEILNYLSFLSENKGINVSKYIRIAIKEKIEKDKVNDKK